MKTAPAWAQDLIINAMVYLQSKGNNVDLPDINWRQASCRKHASGVCHSKHITIVQGHDRIDTRLVILHELAHWALPLIKGHEGHTPKFWDLAWELYRAFKLPIRYCLRREKNYRKGALVAYRKGVKGE